MWPQSYWPNNYWPQSYWPKTGPVSVPPPVIPSTGPFSPFMDQGYDSTGALDTTPVYVFHTPERQPQTLYKTLSVCGGVRSIVAQASAGPGEVGVSVKGSASGTGVSTEGSI